MDILGSEREEQKLLDEEKKKLFEAAEKNDLKTVKYLVEEKKVTLKCRDKDLRTTAYFAAINGHLDIVKYVADKEPAILGNRDRYGNTILHVPVEKNAMDIIEHLEKKYGNNIPEWDRKDFESMAIHGALQFGHWNVLKYFVDQKNSDVNATNDQGEPPIFTAVKYQHIDMLKYLLDEKKANVTMLDDNSDNILFVAVGKDDLFTMKYVLDERKAPIDVNWQNSFGNTLVHRAAILNRMNILEYLVEQKHADVNVLGHQNKTALSYASTRNYYDVCKYLVEHGANTQLKDEFGYYPVQRAFEPQLVEYMRNVSEPRHRRSIGFQQVRLPYEYLKSKTSQGLPRSSRDGAISDNDAHSVQLSSFLVSAVWVFGNAKLSIRRQQYSSPEAILHDKMDPTAVGAVHNLPVFNER